MTCGHNSFYAPDEGVEGMLVEDSHDSAEEFESDRRFVHNDPMALLIELNQTSGQFDRRCGRILCSLRTNDVTEDILVRDGNERGRELSQEELKKT